MLEYPKVAPLTTSPLTKVPVIMKLVFKVPVVEEAVPYALDCALAVTVNAVLVSLVTDNLPVVAAK